MVGLPTLHPCTKLPLFLVILSALSPLHFLSLFNHVTTRGQVICTSIFHFLTLQHRALSEPTSLQHPRLFPPCLQCTRLELNCCSHPRSLSSRPKKSDFFITSWKVIAALRDPCSDTYLLKTKGKQPEDSHRTVSRLVKSYQNKQNPLSLPPLLIPDFVLLVTRQHAPRPVV